ncbi:hypothetical protein DIPPA_27008 [Diplonema papillatum]|nr:hypothetical protein DIPPA_27008 [Diplonema papillatum]|eukprot:gene21673-33361_t
MPSRKMYAGLVLFAFTSFIFFERADCYGPQCSQSLMPKQLLQMKATDASEDSLRLKGPADELESQVDAWRREGSSAESDVDAANRETMHQTSDIEAHRAAAAVPQLGGLPSSEDPMYVPWGELAQFGYRKDEPFRVAFAKQQAATKAEYYARFADIREENLAELRRREEEQPLAGLEPRFARAISTVCDLEEDSEEKKMCERRGRRMVENIRQEYGRLSFTHRDAAKQFRQYSMRTLKIAEEEEMAGQKFRVKSHFMKVMVASGRIVSHDTAGFKKYKKSFFNVQEAIALAWLEGVLRTLPSGNRASITCEVLLQVDDRCGLFNPDRNKHRLPRVYPLVAYSKRTDWCPHITTLMWDSIVQQGYFNSSEPEATPRAVDIKSLKSKMTFRGSGWGPERYFFAAVSASRLLPYVDAGISTWRHTCKKSIAPVYQGKHVNLLAKTPYTNPAKACGPSGQEDDASTWKPQRAFREKVNGLEIARNEKYLLLVDGFSALFRLAPNLKLPGIVFLHPHSRYELPYYPDLLPFVHYVPLSIALNDALSDLDHAYHWLEENPDIAEDIATRSTRFAKKHVNEDSAKHYKRDWHVFLNVMSEMYTTPSAELSEAVDDDGKPFGCAVSQSTRYVFRHFHETTIALATKHELARLACGS